VLTAQEYDIADVRLGPESGIDEATLVVGEADLHGIVTQSSHVEHLDVSLARPGESVRISGVIDVLEPRTKPKTSPGVTFPGIASPNKSCGTGETFALRGVAVTVVGAVPPMEETFVQEDCLIDMNGISAAYSPFSRLPHVVITCRLDPSTPESSRMEEFRKAGVLVSRYLASLAAGHAPSRSIPLGDEQTSKSPGSSGRVVYVCSLISEGPLHDTLLYGETLEDLNPTWLSVSQMIDGALVSSDLHYPNQRTPTYLYQRNPVTESIRTRGGLELLGVILTLRYGSHAAKQEAARQIASMALEAGADSLIVHPAVGGNAHVDAVNIVEEGEKLGLRSVLMLQEMAGARGADTGLVHFVPEADALISTGNRDQMVTLAPKSKLLGLPAMKSGEPLDEECQISLRSFLCSTSQVGAHSLTTVAG
jgi:glycine reductase